MIYSFAGTEIQITDRKDINMVQHKDPITQKFFVDQKEALSWIEQNINDICDSSKLDIVMDFDEEKNTVQFTCSEDITSKIKVDILKDGKFVQNLILQFEEGISSKVLDLEAGEYTIEFNYFISFNDKSFFILQQEKDYQFIVK